MFEPRKRIALDGKSGGVFMIWDAKCGVHTHASADIPGRKIASLLSIIIKRSGI